MDTLSRIENYAKIAEEHRAKGESAMKHRELLEQRAFKAAKNELHVIMSEYMPVIDHLTRRQGFFRKRKMTKFVPHIEKAEYDGRRSYPSVYDGYALKNSHLHLYCHTNALKQGPRFYFGCYCKQAPHVFPLSHGDDSCFRRCLEESLGALLAYDRMKDK